MRELSSVPYVPSTEEEVEDFARRIAELVAERTEPRLLDAAGAARLLGLFGSDGKPLASWVLAQARADRIPYVPLGRYVRFEPDALRAWVAERRRGPGR